MAGEPTDDEEFVPPDPGEDLDPDAYEAFLLKDLYGEVPSPPPDRPVPERWDQLLMELNFAVANHRELPEFYSLHKLDRFELLRLCGEGAYGWVFEARDPRLDRMVAIKLCEVQASGAKAIDKVLAEARTLAKLQHPNVIAVHEVGDWEGDVFFVMDFATGTSVHHFVQQTRPSWQTVIDIYMDAGQGLVAAHEHKDRIIHGDFKPGNVLVNADGSWPRVADFGIARVGLKHTPDETEPPGTLAAPETLRGLAGDERSDQWAFCKSVWRSLEQIEATESVPTQLRDVLQRGLEDEPGDRWPNMRALLEAMDVARQAGPRLVDVVDLEPVSDVLPRRRKGPQWGPSAIALLIAGGSLLAAAQWRRSPEPATQGRALRLFGAPESPCALTRAEAAHVVEPIVPAICDYIRLGRLTDADDKWSAEYQARKDKDGAGTDRALGTDALIVARTFEDQAEDYLLDGKPDLARDASQAARVRATEAANTLGQEHVGVRRIKLRSAVVKWLTQRVSD